MKEKCKHRGCKGVMKKRVKGRTGFGQEVKIVLVCSVCGAEVKDCAYK